MARFTPFDQQGHKSGRDIRGMLRSASELLLPPNYARYSQDTRFKKGIAAKRPGSVLLGTAPALTTGCVVFNGVSDNYIDFPDHPVYDLKTSWLLCVRFYSEAAPASDEYILCRDVSPVSSGKETFTLRLTSAQKLIFRMHDSGGTEWTLEPTTVFDDDLWHTVWIVRSGATLAMYANGDPTAITSRTDLSATLTNIAGSQRIFVGCRSTDDGVTRTSPFNGKVDMVLGMVNPVSTALVMKHTGRTKWPNPRDPHVFLAAYFAYEKEGSGETVYDWSMLENHGHIVGSVTRAANAVSYPQKVQHLGVFRNSDTGEVQNIAWINGVLYSTSVRVGRSFSGTAVDPSEFSSAFSSAFA